MLAQFESLGAAPVTSVSVPFIAEAKWVWNSKRGCFLRWTAGEKHVDAANNKQLWTDNVVIMYASYPQQEMKDPAGSPTFDTVLGGSGHAVVMHDGFMVKCTWKASRSDVPTFWTKDGIEVPLKAGKTWIIVPRIGMDVTFVKPKVVTTGAAVTGPAAGTGAAADAAPSRTGIEK
jgi:hypothetical protein